MPRRITDHQRLVEYAMDASAEQLTDAIGTLKAIQLKRFPPEKRKRKPRVAPVVDKQPELPEMPPRDETLEASMTSD